MVTACTPPWPPVLGTPITESLVMPFTGFSDAAARLAEVTSIPAGRVGPAELTQANVELFSVPGFARAAVEQVRSREGWPGGSGGFDRDQEVAGHGDLLHGFRWARNHASHALARTAEHHEGGRTYPRTYPLGYQPARWVWTPRDQLPAGQRDPDGEGAYDRALAGADLQSSVREMASWLSITAGRLT